MSGCYSISNIVSWPPSHCFEFLWTSLQKRNQFSERQQSTHNSRQTQQLEIECCHVCTYKQKLFSFLCSQTWSAIRVLSNQPHWRGARLARWLQVDAPAVGVRSQIAIVSSITASEHLLRPVLQPSRPRSRRGRRKLRLVVHSRRHHPGASTTPVPRNLRPLCTAALFSSTARTHRMKWRHRICEYGGWWVLAVVVTIGSPFCGYNAI